MPGPGAGAHLPSFLLEHLGAIPVVGGRVDAQVLAALLDQRGGDVLRGRLHLAHFLEPGRGDVELAPQVRADRVGVQRAQRRLRVGGRAQLLRARVDSESSMRPDW